MASEAAPPAMLIIRRAPNERRSAYAEWLSS
jgi:hypothetical protein